MSLTIKTLGCNGLCRSCYENRIRSVSLDTSYDIEAILKTVERETPKTSKGRGGGTVCLHGGEPLLMKFEDIERLLAKVCELYGYTGIQTNGILISDRIIELFKKYKTSVGVSIDGDTAELNYGRWNAKKMSKEEIQRRTNRVLTNMK
ncbi:MAG: radical SAM protein, partial [Candidatus Aenigmarchaeota archaeon]|nr:radical SAM protein [Candidatus Aenigmarchaeota archaeon]